MEILQKGIKYLKENGFDDKDYIVSLQGPTLVLSRSGEKKMEKGMRESLGKIGLKIIG